MHLVFQKILSSDQLKGTLFVPTRKAWQEFFDLLKQRRGNPEAPAMVARYGQILLYHLAQDVAVPIAESVGANKFAVDTASTLQCTFGPGLPNNRLIIKKTPEAFLVQHGTGNATIMSQPISYCGGEAYLVNQVLLPCGDISAVMGEVANIPSPCKSNVESALQKNELTNYNALLLATGVQQPIYSSVRNFTLFVPTDEAINAAYDAGELDYPTLFAKNKTLLQGLVAYHAVPAYMFAAPGKATLAMETLLSQGEGKAACAKPSLSWKADGYVYGGVGSGKVGDAARGCNTLVYPIDVVLQPCCKPLSAMLSGPKGLRSTAPPGSRSAKAYQFLADKVAEGEGRINMILPSEDAWTALEAEMTQKKMNLTDEKVEALLNYMYTRADVGGRAITKGLPVPTGLSVEAKALMADLCPKTANGTIRFILDPTSPAAAAATSAETLGAAPMAPAPAAAAAPAAGVLGAPAAAGPALGAGPAFGPTDPALGSTGPALGATDPALGATPAPTAAAAPAESSLITMGRKLLQLVLPTSYVAPNEVTSGAGGGGGQVAGAISIKDGVADALETEGIPVQRQTYACDATIFNVDQVPLPCNFVNRTAAMMPPPMPPPSPPSPPAPPLELGSDNGTTNETKASAASSAAANLLASGAAAVLLSFMLL